MTDHATIQVRRFPWPVCARCGLVLLRNHATVQAAKAQCRGHFREHVTVGSDARRNSK